MTTNLSERGRPKPRFWTEAERARLIELKSQGHRNRDIARKLGFTGAQIDDQVHKLREEGVLRDKTKIRYWTDEERAQLIALKQSGMRHRDIARTLGRRQSQVDDQLLRLRHSGLIAGKVSASAPDKPLYRAEQERDRALAERDQQSFSERHFGDPPPSRSARRSFSGRL